MKRSQFLALCGIGAVLLIAFGPIAACKGTTTPAAPPATADSKTFTSSSDTGHTHTITIQKTEIETPPAAGISRDTSSEPGHSHTFAMTQAQLQTVKGGTAVNVDTGVTNGHFHTFTIQKWY